MRPVDEPDQEKGSLQSLPLRLFFASLPVIGVLLLGWAGRETVTYFWASSPAALITLPVLMWQHAQRTGEKFFSTTDPNTTDAQASIGICIVFTVPIVFLIKSSRHEAAQLTEELLGLEAAVLLHLLVRQTRLPNIHFSERMQKRA